jgi:hypothetical protein
MSLRRSHILIFCAALLVTLPLIVHGCSCGHDFDFHLQSWLDAAQQLRHGTLLPHWAFSAAYNAGEPRFIFYPPLSWMLGAILTLIFPIASLPAIYTFIALAAAGLAMHRLASHFAPPNAALIAATLYIANPYMLFTAFERTAYAELLAAAWLPLLFLAALRARPTVRGIALPIALLWLTNAPAAVIGCYALALIVTTRIVLTVLHPPQICHPERSAAQSKDLPHSSPQPVNQALSTTTLALTSIAGTALGLTLPAFYLIPAAYERRFVQIAMAIIPNMRFQDNFLFGHTADAPHNEVLHTASLIALTLLIATIAALLAFIVRTRTLSSRPKAAHFAAAVERSQHLSSSNQPPNLPYPPSEDTPATTFVLAFLTLSIAFLLTPLSTPLWNHLPELAFLQFPWRLLSVLAVILALTIALLFRNIRLDNPRAMQSGLVLVTMLTLIAIHHFRQSCDDTDLPIARAQAFKAHQGVEPTDEYTPNGADNDVLRADNPPFWFSSNPTAFAPGTTPNPATFIQPQSAPPNTQSATRAFQVVAPTRSEPSTFTFNAPSAGYLILNLREYPNWDIAVDDPNSLNQLRTPHVPRDDGLIEMRLYNGGDYTVHIAWHRTLDQQLGLAISAIAAAIYVALVLRARSRRIEV